MSLNEEMMPFILARGGSIKNGLQKWYTSWPVYINPFLKVEFPAAFRSGEMKSFVEMARNYQSQGMDFERPIDNLVRL